jgi:spermidine synthase
VYCLLFPSIFPLVRSASVWLPTGEGAFAFAVDTALSAVLIVPPATLMGGTIPILTQALARNLADATRVHALIYGWNTAGAFVGALAAGFFLVEWLGLDGVLHAMGFVNIAAGVVFALLGLQRREVAELDAGAETAALRGGVFAVYGTIALLVGFAMMVLQTIVIRVGGLAFGSSEYTFAMVVAVFVLCIARGSFSVSARANIGRAALVATLWVLALLFAVLYFVIETAPYWAHVLRVMFRDFDAAFYPYYLAAFGAVLLVLGPAVMLSGATLPLLFHTLRREVGDLGSQAGRLYSMNTVGSLLGALIGGYTLLIWLDLHHVYRIAVAALVLAASLATLQQFPRIRFAGAAALLIAGFGALSQFPAWRATYLNAGTFRTRQPVYWTFSGPSVLATRRGDFSFHDDDPNTSVAILDSRDSDGKLTRSILINGKSDGNSAGDYSTTAMLALVPAMFAEHPQQAFVIGFGTGVTAGTLAEFEEVQGVTIAEISSGVIAASPLFDFADNGVSKHPKVRFVHSDAYRALLKGGHSYDVIVSEPSNPWVTGIEQLYSREFLTEARDRLTPGGVYCQWFHRYEIDSKAIALVLKTFGSVFDHAAVWTTNHTDLMLLGFRNADLALDVDRLGARAERPDFRAVMDKLQIADLPTLLVHEVIPLGALEAARIPGPIHSLYHPLLNFEAGRAFFAGHEGGLPFTGYGEAAEVGAANSLLRRYLERDGGGDDTLKAQIAVHACTQNLTGCGALAALFAESNHDPELFQPIAAALQKRKGPMFLPRMRALRNPRIGNPNRRIMPEAAVEVTRLFMQEYTHAAPLDPSALLGFWERCGRNSVGVQMCQPGVHAAKRLLIGDAPPDPDDWLNPAAEAAATEHAAPQPKREEDEDAEP